ncbi:MULTISPECIES: helix-turn-helix domain-containing protein [Streptomyces]|uniref:Helix-turn-helix transcriptional regulator n=4 Tax=Streptomyces TaxID=1883 RepID=A0ABD5JIR6_9ACTN|nr:MULTISPECIES: helix-turn-helix transcriptional regulator [Streptomyces]KUL59378.1 hypothetical protein ADL28_17975 [Streptomyces violaceusniger]MEE4588328.1 helix-turn-helix transcriptional regulator [Streptomyces sp. DSM 41602]RSS43602.1 XRE family transcriptional regulator [Streptomyces sp. WAC05858]
MGAAEKLDPSSSVLAFAACELRRAREEAGMTQRALAKSVFVTPSLLAKLEAAQRVPSGEFAARADEVLNTGGLFGRLWPLIMKYAYPSWFRPYVELEAQAQIIRSFELRVIPGLLQTEDYARAALEAGRLSNVDDLLAARLTRQDILTRENPPELWIILDENVLRRPAGVPRVMHDQLARVIEASETPTTVVQVVPYSAGPHAGVGSFHVLTLEEGPEVVFADGFAQGQLLPDPEHVRAALRAYDLLRAQALSPAASIDLLATTMKELQP